MRTPLLIAALLLTWSCAADEPAASADAATDVASDLVAADTTDADAESADTALETAVDADVSPETVDADHEDIAQAFPDGLVGEPVHDGPPPPAFTGVVDQDGEPVLAEQLLGSWHVLWFYPKASTAG